MRDGTDVRSNQGPFPRSPVRSHAWLPVPLNPRRLLSPLGYLNVGRAGVPPALLRGHRQTVPQLSREGHRAAGRWRLLIATTNDASSELPGPLRSTVQGDSVKTLTPPS